MFMRILISAMQIIESCLTELFGELNEFVYKNHLPISRTLKTVHVNNQYMLSQIFCNVSKIFCLFSFWRIENDNLSVFLKKVFLCINTCWKTKNFCNYSRGTRKLSGLIERQRTLYIYYTELFCLSNLCQFLFIHKPPSSHWKMN